MVRPTVVYSNLCLGGNSWATPNTTQPLDVAIFAPVKTKLLDIWWDSKLFHQNNVISHVKLHQALSLAIDQAWSPNVVKSAFHKYGIFPIDKHAIYWTQTSNVDYNTPNPKTAQNQTQNTPITKKNPPQQSTLKPTSSPHNLLPPQIHQQI